MNFIITKNLELLKLLKTNIIIKESNHHKVTTKNTQVSNYPKFMKHLQQGRQIINNAQEDY